MYSHIALLSLKGNSSYTFVATATKFLSSSNFSTANIGMVVLFFLFDPTPDCGWVVVEALFLIPTNTIHS